MMPVGFLLPEPIVPISDDETPRKFFRRLFHWFSNCTRWTRISVFRGAFCKQVYRDHCLAECGRGRQYSQIIFQQRYRRLFLFRTEFPLKYKLLRLSTIPFIGYGIAYFIFDQKRGDIIGTAAWQTLYDSEIFRTTNDTRLS